MSVRSLLACQLLGEASVTLPAAESPRNGARTYAHMCLPSGRSPSRRGPFSSPSYSRSSFQQAGVQSLPAGSITFLGRRKGDTVVRGGSAEVAAME